MAIVLLSDHVHCIWTLPENDHDFSTRWSFIKSCFTRRYLAAGGHESAISDSRRCHEERGVWQRRFWEHLIRDQDDLNRHLNYIHYNPVKHAHCACPHAWPHSSFDRWVASGMYEVSWQCACNGHRPPALDFSGLALNDIEPA
jgi:putative transposase